MSTETSILMEHIFRSHDLVRSWPNWKKNIWPENIPCTADVKTEDISKKTSPLLFGSSLSCLSE